MSSGVKYPVPTVRHDPVPELQSLLGQPSVFIAWPRGMKGTKQRWKHLTRAHMTPEYLANLKNGNIGVALGSVSGGLCAIDWDDAEFIKPFLTSNPSLAGTLQTRGQRGQTFWVLITGPLPKSSVMKTHFGEAVGEFRADGNQSIVWGIHPDTQKPYQFIVKKPVVPISFDSIKWPTKIANPPSLQRDGSHDSVSSVSLDAPSLCLSVNSVKTVEEAAEISIPSQPHQNNAALFKLARAIKAVEAQRGPLPKRDRLKAFTLWFDRAHSLGLLRDGQTKDQYLAEFINAGDCAKHALGESPAEEALKRAKAEPPPPEADIFSSDEAKLLVGVCYQLEKMSAGQPWFLACRTAAQFIGMNHTGAAKILKALVTMGVLKVVEANTTTKATRYRYVGQTPEAAP